MATMSLRCLFNPPSQCASSSLCGSQPKSVSRRDVRIFCENPESYFTLHKESNSVLKSEPALFTSGLNEESSVDVWSANSDAGIKFSHGKLLSEVSSWGIGGPARLFVEVHTEGQLRKVLSHCHRNSIPAFFLGRGSNCLFDDRGFHGCVILNSIRFLEQRGPGRLRVGSGYPFNSLGVETAKQGLTGLEFAAGIPGTVGGAVFMNAGAQSQETFQVLESVEAVSLEGEKKVLRRECGELAHGYRASPFQKEPGRVFITAATFRLHESDKARPSQLVYMDKRRKSQPLLEKTAGCVFRNPGEGGKAAGQLIEELGLKGLSVGGAQVSSLHGNFLVNRGGSSCKDMLELIGRVKEMVAREAGIQLEEEVLYVPYDGKVYFGR